jgi:hypothetical protein
VNTVIFQADFTAYLLSVEHFDISTREAVITAYYDISWKDEYLTWDPSEYGGQEILHLPEGKFWMPDIVLTLQPVNTENTVYFNGAFSAWVTYHGDLTLIQIGTYQTRCKVDTTLYPFDIHQCNFQFIMMSHRVEDLKIRLPTKAVDTDLLRKNGEWYIEDTNVTVVVVPTGFKIKDYISSDMVDVSFTLRRRPTFIINNIYVPIILMSSLNIATCYVRPDSGERLSFAVTLYLSLVFATTAAIESIPNNSLKMPYMSYEILMINFINTIGVAWSIFIVRLSNIKNIDQKKIPNFLLKMVRKRNKMTRSLTIETYVESVGGSIDLPQDDDVKSKNEKCEEVADSIKTVIWNDVTGHDLAEVVDNIYFWLMFIAIFALLVSFAAIVVVQWARS